MRLGNLDMKQFAARDNMQHTLYTMLGLFDDADLQLHGYV